MDDNMKKGFTLIELLAVIVILAIVALITTPIILTTIQSSKEKALTDTAYSLVLASGTYQAEKQALNEDTTLTVNYTTGTNKTVLKVKGNLPDAGGLEIKENGKVRLALWSNSAKACAVKNSTAKETTINRNIKSSTNCNLTLVS
jgi:type IV pilus assembly protein PilA